MIDLLFQMLSQDNAKMEMDNATSTESSWIIKIFYLWKLMMITFQFSMYR